jgi:hypothetical protein
MGESCIVGKTTVPLPTNNPHLHGAFHPETIDGGIVELHSYAYSVLTATIAAVFDLIPNGRPFLPP